MNDRTSIPQALVEKSLAALRIPRAGEGAGLTLLTSLRRALSRKWLIAGTAALVFGMVYLVVNAMTPIYRATATVLVETNKNQVVSIEQIVGTGAANREYFQTQVEFLKSRDVTARVVRDLNLMNHPAYAPEADRGAMFVDKLVEQVRVWVSGAMSSSKDDTSKDDTASQLAAIARREGRTAPAGSDSGYAFTESRLIDLVQDSLNVQPIRMSQLIGVSFDSPDPLLASTIANGIADAYIRSDLDARFEVTQKASRWLNERLEELRIKLEESERNLQRLRELAGIVRTPETTFGGSARQMDTASDRLVQARVARAQAEEVYRQVLPGARNRYVVPQVFNNPSVVRAREVLGTADRRLADVQQRLGTSHPEYLRADSEYRVAKQDWIAQSEAVISSIAKEFEVARSTEAAVQREIESAQSSIKDINRKELSLDSAEREVNALRQLYQTFLSRVKETSAMADFQSTVARVIDPAVPQEKPVRPARKQVLAVALLLGLCLGFALAFLLEQLNRSVRSTDDVELLLDQPLLSTVPLDNSAARGNLLEAHAAGSNSLFGESVRTAVTGVQLSVLDLASPIVVFTSSVPGEGKSTIATSFALEMARSKRVLLVDADLRRPSIAARLGLSPNRPGLSELIEGRSPVQDCISFLPNENLHVITSGRRAKNPLNLLLTDALSRRLLALSAEFEMIVVDSPPIELVSDVLLIGRTCSGLVYVVRSDSTEIPMIRRGLDRIRAADIRVLGVVLNAHNFTKASRYFGESSAQAKYDYSYGAEGSSAKSGA